MSRGSDCVHGAEPYREDSSLRQLRPWSHGPDAPLMPTYDIVSVRRTVADADIFSLPVDCREIPVRSKYPEVERV